MYNTQDNILLGEFWKDIPSFEALYQASNLGRIRSHPNKITSNCKFGHRHWKCRILKPRGDYSTGYRVTLWKENRCKDFLVARLVCITFHGYSDMTVNHIDGNRFNNRIENLEWLTIGDNIRHGFINNLYPQIRCKLTSENYKSIAFRSLSQASQFLGRSNGYVSGLLKKSKYIATNENNEEFYVDVGII